MKAHDSRLGCRNEGRIDLFLPWDKNWRLLSLQFFLCLLSVLLSLLHRLRKAGHHETGAEAEHDQCMQRVRNASSSMETLPDLATLLGLPGPLGLTSRQ